MNFESPGSGASGPSLLAHWKVILVKPQTAANVGAACRVSRNFGCATVEVIDPQCEFEPMGPAWALARGAADLLESLTVHESLQEALAECTFAVALTARTGEDRPRDFRGLIPVSLLEGRPRGGASALVFGPEESGLTNEDCALCNANWMLPTRAEFPSLNLAQAVAISLAGLQEAESTLKCTGPSSAAREAPPAATLGQLQGLWDHVEQVLRAAEFERGVPLAYPINDLKRLLARAHPGNEEVQLLRGICRRLLNALLGYERRG